MHSRAFRRVAIAIVATLIAVVGAGITAGPARAANPTVSSDNLRTAWDSNEPGLSPANVTSSDFGQLFSVAVSGQVYAEPIVAAGTLIAADEKNNVYGLDPATGATRWTRNIGAAWPAATTGCGDLSPWVGITSTPVYDPASGSVFFVAKVNDGVDAAHPHFYVHSVNPATGAERQGWPVIIQGAPSNDPGHPFNPMTASQRPGLLLLDGVVYAGFASHCDFGPYVGYVVGVSTTSPQVRTMWSTEAGSSHAEAGIWQSGGGLVSDGPGRIILTTGNGVSPAPGPGSSPPATLGESVVRLAVNGDGTLTPQSFFSPANNAKLDQNDADLGSGGPMELPAGYGTATHPHLVVQVGKDGRVFLLDADNLGGNAQGPAGTDLVVGTTGPFPGVWGSPGFWGGNGGYVYSVENGGPLRVLRLSVDGTGTPALASVGTSAGTFGFGSGSPTITSTGTSDGSAVVWVMYTPGPNQPAELRGYDAVPTAGVLKLRYSAPIGLGSKFTRIATDNGRLYLGTHDAHIVGFGRPTTSPITATPTDFGSIPVNQTANSSVTITAAKNLTINGISTTAPFGVDPQTYPIPLTKGQTLAVPISFSPTAPGAASGTLSFDTDAGTTALGLQGRGTQPGLAAEPSPLDFGVVPTKSAKNLTVSISNTGTSAETVTGFNPPGAANTPFTVTGAPANGSTIPAGGSLAISVTYTPTAVGGQSDSMTVTGSQGSVMLPITGTGISGAAVLTTSPNPLNFGSVPIGVTASLTFDISNTGNIALTLAKAAPPTGVFNAPKPVAEGQMLAAGDVLHQTVTFTPTAAGPVSAAYEITSDDGNGPQDVTITGTGVNDPISAKVMQLAKAGQPVGNASGPETVVGAGKYEVFTGGTIYWSQATGAHVIKGPLASLYRTLGGPTGVLGFPTTDQLNTADGTGRYNNFANNGSIYWTTPTGAHEVHGSIRTKWLALGAEHGIMGYPTTNQTPTSTKTGFFNNFSKNASIYTATATGTHETHGLIRTKWLSLGAVRGAYGYPTSDVVTITGGQRQTFKGGTLTLKAGKVT